MALEHALLVALSEQPAAGADLTRRFSRSIGYFWPATHQQIYRVLARMESDGWLEATEVTGSPGPTRRRYAVTDAGARALSEWLEQPTEAHSMRSDLAVKLRGASFGDRSAVGRVVATNLADHQTRLAHYEHLMRRDYPEPGLLSDHELDQYLVLRGGVLTEQAWISWLTECLERTTDADQNEHEPHFA